MATDPPSISKRPPTSVLEYARCSMATRHGKTPYSSQEDTIITHCRDSQNVKSNISTTKMATDPPSISKRQPTSVLEYARCSMATRHGKTPYSSQEDTIITHCRDSQNVKSNISTTKMATDPPSISKRQPTSVLEFTLCHGDGTRRNALSLTRRHHYHALS